ncbi:cation:proton antiporter [Gammaproteobacteria bacterium]|jgi:Kef-type K+ transport system membrane component KefB|nr:cation:proton antiporter [Gammaproteobacteria bacterium]
MQPGLYFGHGDPIAPVILGVTSILAFAVIGRVVARKLSQPTVLGELLMGILLGNIAWYYGVDLIAVLREGPRVFDVVNQTLMGAPLDQVAISIFGADKGPELARIIRSPHGGQVMQVAQAVDVFSRYGVIFLLFMVGLNTNLDEMRSVGRDSIRVAIIGVIMPLTLGYLVVILIRPEMSFNSSLFIAATLGATSIGITANVLKEMGRSGSREGKIILGAAVGDDILGLVILAVVSGIVVSGSVDIAEVSTVIVVSTLFLIAAVKLGPLLVRIAATIMRRLDIVEAKMFTSYLFVMVLAWMANLAGLATIIGAFAAGVVLHDSFFARHENSSGSKVVSIRELIMPLEVILVPIFFILMGIQVKIESFLSWPVVTLAGGLLVAAVVGKLASGLGASKPAAKLVVAIGMLPRGEVGLVFAAIGRTLGVIDDSVFAAIVLMVFITTLAAPSWLKAELSRQIRQQKD